MKKLLLVMFVALFCLNAQAQKKGDFAVGVRANACFSEITILDVDAKTTQFGVGAFAQYNLADSWRIEAEANFHPMKNHVSDVLLALNMHYLVNLAEGLKIYPVVGYGIAFVHNEEYTEDRVTYESSNDTDSGFQIGVGLQYDLSDNMFLTGEYKYQPGIFGNAHVALAGIGFRF